MGRARKDPLYDAFSMASSNLAAIAAFSCVYMRGDFSIKLKCYWNAPSIVHWDVSNIGVGGQFREWYLPSAVLKRKGIGEPREFDRIGHGGDVWEIFRHQGGSFMRDATPDIVVLTRLIAKGE